MQVSTDPDEIRASLPAPETLLAYAEIMLKPYRDFKGGVINQPGEIAQACAAALRLAALTQTMLCGSCGSSPFPGYYPADGAEARETQ